MGYSVNVEQRTDEKVFTTISSILEKTLERKKRNLRYATTKEVLVLLGKGVLLTTLFIAPGAGRGFKSLSTNDVQDRWKKFNTTYLRRTIKRLHDQKMVEFIGQNDIEVIKITEKGRRRILSFTLEHLDLTVKPWDGKWRIVLYDIPVKKQWVQRSFREALKRLKFLSLQKSVYLTPYPCDEEIEFLREYYGLSNHITLLTIGKLENEKLYREYFGLN